MTPEHAIPAALNNHSPQTWMQRYEPIIFPCFVFLILRLMTAYTAVISLHNMPTGVPDWFMQSTPAAQTFAQALPADAPLYEWTWPWHRWDTAWYLKIAIQGYVPNDPSVVFPPLYPLLIRLIAPLCAGNKVLASLLVSNLACLIAFALLFRLVLHEFKNLALARSTVIGLAAFPTTFFLVAGYTESLFLALALAAFLAALKERWWLAGILSALAALTRLQGVILCLPLAWIAYAHKPLSPVQNHWRTWLARLPAAVGAAVGLLLYLAYLSISQLGSMEAAWQNHWNLDTRPPWQSVLTYLERLFSGQTIFFENDNALAVLFILSLGIVVVFKFRPAYWLYVFATLTLLLIRYHDGTQFDSISRYTLVIFPCFIALGMALKRWWLLIPYALGAGYWQIVLVDRFVHWGISG